MNIHHRGTENLEQPDEPQPNLLSVIFAACRDENDG